MAHMCAVGCSWSLFRVPLAVGALIGPKRRQARLSRSRGVSVRITKHLTLISSAPRGSRVKSPIVCVAATESSSKTAGEHQLMDVNGIGKVTEAELIKSGEITSVEILKKIWTEDMMSDADLMKRYLGKFNSIKRNHAEAIVSWLAEETKTLRIAGEIQAVDEPAFVREVLIDATSDSRGFWGKESENSADEGSGAQLDQEPPLQEQVEEEVVWEVDESFSLYMNLCKEYNPSTPRMDLEVFGEALFYEVEARYGVAHGEASVASYNKLVDYFYRRNPVLVNAVYLCFVENATSSPLNIEHVLSVVALVDRNPLSAEVWWYALSALRLDSVSMESDELISLIEEVYSMYENNLSERNAQTLVSLFRCLEDKDDIRVEAPDTLRSVFEPNSMYLIFIHSYLVRQEEERALEVYRHMPTSVLTASPLYPRPLEVEGEVPELLQYTSYLELLLRVTTAEMLPDFFTVFIKAGAASIRLFQSFAEKALKGPDARYGPLVALYDTYIEAERERFLKGISTDLLAMLAEHVRDRRQRAGYETFYTLVERALCTPDVDRFRRDYVNAKSSEVKELIMPEVRELLQDFGAVYFKKVIEFNPRVQVGGGEGEAAPDEKRRYMRKARVLSMTTEHFFKACLLADPALVYGFTKPFDNYFKEYVDKRSMAAVSKFLTQQCAVPAPVVSRLMHSPNFYHPAIFELVQRRKAKELATCEALLGAKQYLTAVEVFMKLNEINAKDLKDTLKDMADLSQVTDEFPYIFDILSSRVLEMADSERVTDSFDSFAFKACLTRMGTAFKHIKFPEGMMQLEKIVQQVFERDPVSWVAQLDALDTVIFFLNYAQFERLDMTYTQFEMLNPRKQTLDLLAQLKTEYTGHIVPLENPLNVDARIADLKAPTAPDATDFQLVQRIVAYVVENMKLRLGTHFMPHHTQLLTLMMFIRSESLDNSKPNIIAQVGTGEGKSLIIAMLAAFHVLRGHSRVNVLVDNLSLLERDFATFEGLFTALGITSASAASQQQVDANVQVCYHTAHSLEVQYLKALVGDGAPVIPEDAVLIVDEVDGLIVDEDVNRSYVYEDKRASLLITGALEQQTQARKAKGARGDAANMLTIMGDEHRQLANDIMAAQTEMDQQVNGRDYTVDHAAKRVKMLDKYARPREQAYELWLELLNNKTFGTPVRYLAPQFLLSRPHVLKKHSKIMGLSGSLGNDAEQDFVKEVYNCDLLLVPPFLDCCRGKSKQRATCHGVHMEEDQTAHYQRIAVEAVRARDSGVPVLVIMKSDQAVQELAQAHLQPMLGEACLENNELSTVTSELFSESRSRFKDKVDSATKVAGTGKYRITVTSPIGARGQDYRVQDDAVEINGGLMLVIGYVPDSEREYIQFLGRTARQDRRGQFLAVLLKGDYSTKALEGSTTTGSSGDDQTGVVYSILQEGSKRVREKLKAQKNIMEKGMLMNEISEKLFPQREASGFQSEKWVNLIRTYRNLSDDDIQAEAGEIAKTLQKRNSEATSVKSDSSGGTRVENNGKKARQGIGNSKK